MSLWFCPKCNAVYPMIEPLVCPKCGSRLELQSFPVTITEITPMVTIPRAELEEFINQLERVTAIDESNRTAAYLRAKYLQP